MPGWVLGGGPQKATKHQLRQLTASEIMGKSLNLIELKLLQMLIPWQYL